MEENIFVRFFDEFRNEWKNVLSFFVEFAKNPQGGICRYPNWHFQTLVIISCFDWHGWRRAFWAGGNESFENFSWSTFSTL